MSQALRPERVRAAALEVLGNILEEGQLADRALARVLRREKSLFSAERRAVAEQVYGLLRRERGLRDALERGLRGKTLASFTAGEVHLALLLGHLQLSGQETPLAALSPQLRRAVEALPRTVQEGLAESDEPGARLALLHSLPEWLAAQLEAELGAVETASLFAALNRRGPLTVRTNVLKGTREGLLVDLAELGVSAHPTRYSPWGVGLEGNPNVFALPPFKAGRFEVQDEGSQLLALLCRARPGQIAVDACAGGGGKTLALAAEMHNRGELWALDNHPRRLAQLKPRARRAGVHNVRSVALEGDPEAPFPEALAKVIGGADLVLVDAPCSGIGALRRNPDARRRLTAESVAAQALEQESILGRMAGLVKPGGLLVYATCSVLRAENETVVARFLTTHPDFASAPLAELLGADLAERLEAPLRDGSAGLRSPLGLRLWPQRHGTDGFFAAPLRRR